MDGGIRPFTEKKKGVRDGKLDAEATHQGRAYARLNFIVAVEPEIRTRGLGIVRQL